MSSKLRLKFGAVEIEYEGETVFDKAGILELIETISTKAEAITEPDTRIDDAPVKTNGKVNKLSMTQVAQKLAVKSNRDLVLAASIYLHNSGKETFSRRELIAAMREAKTFWKNSYSGNLSTSLDRLVRGGDLTQHGADYGLMEAKLKQLQVAIAR